MGHEPLTYKRHKARNMRLRRLIHATGCTNGRFSRRAEAGRLSPTPHFFALSARVAQDHDVRVRALLTLSPRQSRKAGLG